MITQTLAPVQHWNGLTEEGRTRSLELDHAPQEDHIASSINVPIPVCAARVTSAHIMRTVRSGAWVELLRGEATRANLRGVKLPYVGTCNTMDLLQTIFKPEATGGEGNILPDLVTANVTVIRCLCWDATINGTSLSPFL